MTIDIQLAEHEQRIARLERKVFLDAEGEEDI